MSRPQSADLSLQVHVAWGDVHLDTRHFAAAQEQVVFAAREGWLWSLLGVPLGYVPPGAAPWLRATPPLLSEVTRQPRGDFQLGAESLGEDESVVAFRSDSRGWVASIPVAWHPTVQIDGKSVDLDELRELGRSWHEGDRIALGVDARTSICFAAEGMTWSARAVSAPKAVPGSHRHPRDRPFMAFSGMAAALGLITASWLALAPRPPAPEPEILDEPLRLAMVLPRPAEPEPEPPPKVDPASGKRAPGKAGEVGRKVPTRKTSRLQPKSRLDKAVAMNSGVLRALADLGDLAVGNFPSAAEIDSLGKGPRGLGYELGKGGLWGKGDGPGGGGQIATFGGPSLSDYGGPGGPGDGPGQGFGPKREAAGPKAIDTYMQIGSLSRSEVEAVILRHMASLRYCYSRELQRQPTLSGSVSVKFTISGGGEVSRASVARTSLHHAKVESCLETRFLKMTFPEPQGGGSVVVRYPMVFAPA